MDSMFEGAGDFFDDEPFEMKQDVSMGFYCCPAGKPGLHTVFDFRNGHEIDVTSEKIRGLPQSLKERFDEDPTFSQIRELRVFQDYSEKNETNINTDIGVEIIYEGQIFNVVSQQGSETGFAVAQMSIFKND